MNCPNVNPSHRLQFFTCYSSVGPFHGLQSFRSRLVQRASPMGPQLLPGACSGAPPPPPSSLTWVSAGLFLSHLLTPLLAPAVLPLLKYVTTEVQPMSLMGSAVVSGGCFLELALLDMGEASGIFSQNPLL